MRVDDTMVYLGKSYKITYQDCDDFCSLPIDKCKQVYGICFYKDKIVVGFSRKMQSWSLIGGTVEAREPLEVALKREIQEESNMKLLRCTPIGYQVIASGGDYQLRYACEVEPYGPFVLDPDAGANYGVDRIKLVKPEEFSKYVKWGKIGDRLLDQAIQKHKLSNVRLFF